MSLILTAAGPTKDTRKPLLSREAAAIAVLVALVTLFCVGMSLALDSVVPLVGALVVVLAAVAASLYRPTETSMR